MTQTIIGLCGRKQSGKGTAVNFITGLNLVALGIVKDNFSIDEKGMLNVTDIFGDTDFEGIFDVNRGTPAMVEFLSKNLDPYMKVYNFADMLKQEVCMKILGLTFEQCYGTDEQKNSLTILKWEDMPGMVTPSEIVSLFLQAAVDGTYYEELLTTPLKTGLMTAREVMQYVGTNIFRKMYGDVWAASTIRRIIDEESSSALITDCRFPNEVEAIQKAGGKVIRLTRDPHHDTHYSETALDKENFDWSKFDAVIDNANMSIEEQNVELYKILKNWNMLPVEIEGIE